MFLCVYVQRSENRSKEAIRNRCSEDSLLTGDLVLFCFSYRTEFSFKKQLLLIFSMEK